MKGKQIGTFCLALLMILWIPLQVLAAAPEELPDAAAVSEELPEEPDAAVSEGLPEEPDAAVSEGLPEELEAEETPETEELLLESSGEAKLFQCGAFEGEQTIPDEADLFANDDLYALIYQGLMSREAKIDVASVKAHYSVLSNLYDKVINDHPELFYVQGGYSYSSYTGSGILVSITPTYYTRIATDEAIAEFDEAVKKALECVKDEMKPLEKAIALHDYLVLKCFYNKEVGANQNLQPSQVKGGSPWTAYGALVEGDPVCQGYSLAYKYLLGRVGVECVIVSSSAMRHAWNQVKMDDNWYHVDVTWDDPLPDVVGRSLYSNFLRSDTGIGSTGHTSWSAMVYCTSKKYETDYVFNGLKAPMHWNDGKNYYIKKGSGSNAFNNYDVYTGMLESESQKIGSIDVFITTITNGNYYSYIYDNFGIAWWGDSLYYVNPDKAVICYSLSGLGEKILGTVSFEPTGTADGNNDPKWDTICLLYKNEKIQAVSKGTLQVLGEFAPYQFAGPSQIIVEEKTARAGNTVDVQISLSNNPGIVSMKLEVEYDESVMTLTEVTDCGILGEQKHSYGMHSPYTLSWANDVSASNIMENGPIVTLSFAISPEAEAGVYPIYISYDNENGNYIFDKDRHPVDFKTVPGSITVTDVIIGDANKDGHVTDIDWAYVARYLAGWNGYTDAEVDLAAADVNKDSRVTSVDRMILARHLAKWIGYDELPYTSNAAARLYDLNPDDPTILVSDAVIQADGTAAVTISLKNNPGIVSMLLKVYFDESALTLEAVEDTGALGAALHSDNKGSPYTLCWANDTVADNFTEDGTIVTLRFRPKEDAAEDSYAVAVQYALDKDEILDKDMNQVSFQVVDGSVYKKTFSLGTIQADGNALLIPIECPIEHLDTDSKLTVAFYDEKGQLLGISVKVVDADGVYSIENAYSVAARVSALLLDDQWSPFCEKKDASLTNLLLEAAAQDVSDTVENPYDTARVPVMVPDELRPICEKMEVELTELPE